MSVYINEDVSYFESFDFENAKPIKHPMIAKMQARAKEAQVGQEQSSITPTQILGFFDTDVLSLIMQHQNDLDRKRANTVLRALFATA